MSRYSLNYAQVVAMLDRQASRVVILDAAGFVILFDLLNELSSRHNWNNNGVELTDSQWDTVENWVAATAQALMTEYECEDYPPWENGDVSYAIMRDEKANATHGGSSAAGVWNNRVLNTKTTDLDSIVVLSSNLFTPIEGVYRINVAAPTRNAGEHRCRLYNVTQSAVVEEGQNKSNAGTASSVLQEVFSADGSDQYRIDSWVKNGVASTGLGFRVSTGTQEVYTQVLLEKIG